MESTSRGVARCSFSGFTNFRIASRLYVSAELDTSAQTGRPTLPTTFATSAPTPANAYFVLRPLRPLVAIVAAFLIVLELLGPSAFVFDEASFTVRVFLLTVNVCVMVDPRREPV